MPDFEHGNQLWRIRSTHGRDTIAEDPDKLKDSFIEFAEWSIEHPLEQQDFAGGYAVIRKTPRPFTIKAFAVFCGASESWWRNFKQSQAVLKNPDFLTVIAWIEDVMYTQKFEGAAIGMYKENLISRDLGLRDGVNMDHTSKGNQLLPIIANMSIEELKQLRDGEPESPEEDIGSGD